MPHDSHRLEADERFFLRHGEAVAVDSLFSAIVAEAKGLFPAEQTDSLLALYARLGLPCSISGVTAATYMKVRDEIANRPLEVVTRTLHARYMHVIRTLHAHDIRATCTLHARYMHVIRTLMHVT